MCEIRDSTNTHFWFVALQLATGHASKTEASEYAIFNLRLTSWMMLSRTFVGYVLITTGVVNCAAFDDSTWYKRYPAYPEYCSTPEQMQRRAIPPLQENPCVGETRLVHVTSIIRHGARVVDDRLDCWKGYLDNPETGVWDCNLTDILALPLAAGSDDATFLLEKKYDTSPLKNYLKGTCGAGQLVLRGAQQELQNGEHLRNAYTYDGSTLFEHDPRMCLFDWNSDDPPPYQQIHVRSDDNQRMIMSAQLVLKGLFGDNMKKHTKHHGRPPAIPLHTANTEMDVMSPHRLACPRMNEIRDESFKWDKRKEFYKSNERKTLLKFMKDELGGADMVNNAMECIMTTICMDRPLPEALDDYGRPHNATLYHKKYGKNLLKRVSESDFEIWGFAWRYDDGAFVKIGMGPLWAEIMRNILPIVNRTHNGEYKTTPPIINRLALFSGHDTTILPLLVSLSPNLWDGQWAPYAAMMIIEIHEIIDGLSDRAIYKSNFAFRLLMDGKVLTSKMEGCPTDMDLCDVQVLLDRVTPFATTNRNCTKTKAKSSPTTTNNSSVDQDTPFVTTNLNNMATKPESSPSTSNNSSVDRDTPLVTTNLNNTATKPESSPMTSNNSSVDRDTPFVTTNLNNTATKPEFSPMTPNNSSINGFVLQLGAMLMTGFLGSLATFFIMTRRLQMHKDLRGDYLSLTRSHHTLSTPGAEDAEDGV